jgi:MFS family permease
MDPRLTMESARPRGIPAVAAYTWRRQWRAEIFIGLCSGILGLSAFVSQRALGAPAWVVPLITVAGQVPWILAPAWEPLLAKIHPQHAFLMLGVLSKGPLLLVGLVAVARTGSHGEGSGDWALFLAAVVLFFLVDGAYIPHRGALLRANFPTPVRGRMFGLLSTVALLASIVANRAGGELLDRDPTWLRVLFPAAAACGIAGHVFLARIRWRRDGEAPVPPEPGLRAATAAFARAWRQALVVLGKDRDFRTFEVGFMLYGFGLLMSTPLLVVFAEKHLGLSTNEFSWAQGAAQPLAHLGSVWLIGRLSDRIGLVRTTALSFLTLVAFFALLPAVGGAAGLIPLYLLLGVAMAGVNIGWNLGPLRFAPEGRSRTYTSVHVLLVGVRSGTAPLVGYALGAVVSFDVAFGLSAALQAAAFVTLWRLSRRVR